MQKWVKDYREWLDLLESNGQLRRIKAEVDWNEEIGAITRMVMSACLCLWRGTPGGIPGAEPDSALRIFRI